MVKSMTGYGIAQFENEQFGVVVEIKTLNSKFLDIVTKIPKEVASIENELRKIISDRLFRGKISLSIEISLKSNKAAATKINKDIFDQYTRELRTSTKALNLTDSDIFRSIMSMSDVFEKEDKSIDLVDPSIIKELTNKAAIQCDEFRIKEGKSIEKAMTDFGQNISNRLESIKKKDPARIESIKNRINDSLLGVNSAENIDTNRFEQEIIYYLEKLDITEEFVRLENHMSFFQETLASNDSQGKKIGFISQEMGREINTIGSKANDSDIQKQVVEMKDELEKIKEQVLNIV
ncbi:MAG: YicC family protein [Reichenbachiella sp.]